ncbi:hypothetical protein NDU88_004805 [Pleurodeles waltl]|uniref:Uncharacterized protein n=1 Tax=Pleurodeles waltl TaxID=8319 RepID=A0AAV7T960_PLEWA|nr:hypothetical protein NDU88_004805 [Pleurodeles waltl]
MNQSKYLLRSHLTATANQYFPAASTSPLARWLQLRGRIGDVTACTGASCAAGGGGRGALGRGRTGSERGQCTRGCGGAAGGGGVLEASRFLVLVVSDSHDILKF